MFFDFDGVLVDSMPAHVAAWRQTLERAGIVLDDLYIELHEGEKAEVTIGRLLREHKLAESDREVHEWVEFKRALYRPMAPQGLVPGARAVIDNLKSRDIQCCIVTGSVRRNLKNSLRPEEIELFSHIISADDYANGKPSPDPYLTALRATNLPRDACRVLENAPLGIQSARAAGLFTVGITTTLPANYLRDADAVIAEYGEFLNYV